MRNAKLYIRLFGIISFILFSVLLLSCRKKDAMQPLFSGFPPDTTSSVNTDTTIQSTDTIPSGKIFLALGDSYTIGQSVDSSERFPAQTAALLLRQNIRFSPIRYIAVTGWTTTNLTEAIAFQQPQGPFDAVTLLIGVNDQYQNGDTTGYRSRFTSLLNTSIQLAGGNQQHVFVLSIPDYGVTPFGSGRPGISEQIDMFNSINKEVTESYGISYTDVTTISRNDAGDATMIAPDGLHPSGKQYAQWAQALDEAMYNALK